MESLGSDVFVYFTRELGQGVNSAELEELARDSGRAEAGTSGDTVVARLDAATQIREGENAELWVDARAMHIFDPATGRNLSLASEEAGGGATQVSPVVSGAGQAVRDEGAADRTVAGDASSSGEAT